MDLISLSTSGIQGFFTVIVPFLVVLTVIVFVHEMGHFLVARWCGVKVDVFA
ncbi:MAG: RIP metalloprotease RseP, partial [Rhizobiales bacterium]|nr:RIP metalloprotease RseP [Hyphomicrobiales bacterium]